MLGDGAIGQFPIGGPPSIVGTWRSTEAKDTFAAAGVYGAPRLLHSGRLKL
jgi:hypothetical protein